MDNTCIRRINRLLAAGRRRLRRQRRRASAGRPTACALRLVSGSPAADADCLAASIGFAFLQSLDAPPGLLVLPWVPVPRAELALRPEVQLLVRRSGVAERLLACAEDFAPERLEEGGGRQPALAAGPELVLVDSDGAWLPAAARARIVEVLDHHPGARRPAEAPAARWTVDAVGSACTLVAERLFARGPELVDAGLAQLLLGPILLDTVLFDTTAERTTPRDRQAARRLAGIAGVQEGELYVELLAARQGLPGLNSRDLLRRDFKSAEAGGVRYGISSSPVSLRRWRERDPAPEEAVRRFREERGLDLLLVMIAYEEPGAGGFRRELGVVAAGERLAAAVLDWLKAAGLWLRELPCAASSGAPQVRWFSQEAVEVSRKKLEPRLRAWLEGELLG